MSTLYRNALYATDLRFKSFSAGEKATQIAQALNIKQLSLLHVIESKPILLLDEVYQAERQLLLYKLAELAEYSYIKDFELQSGNPKRVILEYIKDYEIDLLFLNARTHQGFEQLGSVARFLTCKAPCAIWLLPFGREYQV